MNGKKIMGNAGKATLPGGKKMSDFKKLPQAANKNSQTSGSNGDNKEAEEKKNSKADQLAKGVGSEALKKGLKTAFPYIPQFVINKLVDSKLGQEVIEKTLKKTKKKIIVVAICFVGSALLHLAMLAGFFALIAAPIAWLTDTIESVGDFFKSIWHWIEGKGFCPTEKKCQAEAEQDYYDTLKKKVKKYNKEFSCEINEDLITATIFYGQMVDSKRDEAEGDDSGNDKFYDYLDVKSNTTDNQSAEGQINTLLWAYFNGSAEDKEYTDEDMKAVESCTFLQQSYRQYLIDTYIPGAYGDVLEQENITVEKAADEIMEMGNLNLYGSNGLGGSCTGSCSYVIKNKTVSNIMVRLLQGTDMDHGEPIPGEDLVPFEKYILGVVYAEIGNTKLEAYAQVEAIAARSYVLTRNMGKYAGLEQEDGQWILHIRNSTNDQVYCDPDKGCSKIGGENSTTFSDPNKYNRYKGPLPEDSPLRTYVSEVVGQVALNSKGEIVHTPYINTDQNNWENLAKQGLDYTEILIKHYKEKRNIIISTIEGGNCDSTCAAASGPYTEWKQWNWPNVYIRTKTIKDVGCLFVSVCMQIARSGVKTPLGDNFNPGTLMENYRDILYTSEGSNLWVWRNITKVVPDFVYSSQYNHSGMAGMSNEKQIDLIQDGLNKGCYYIAEVKSYKGTNYSHYVAIDYIKDGKIYMIDPASNCKVVNECKASEGFYYRISSVACYTAKKKGDGN